MKGLANLQVEMRRNVKVYYLEGQKMELTTEAVLVEKDKIKAVVSMS